MTLDIIPIKEMSQPQTPFPPGHKTVRTLEQGRYTMTDLRWGMALDLSREDYRSLIAYELHGEENQQARHVCRLV